MSITTQLNKFQEIDKWKEIFDKIGDQKFLDIDNLLEDEYEKYKGELEVYPSIDKIFYSFELTKLEDLKVCILGQDPYHKKGQAMGLSFSVPIGEKIPPSLVNIYKEIKNDLGDSFNIPNHGDLTNWGEQGVLLLNASLTVREHCPNSHAKYWKNITDSIIEYISQNCDHIIFLLWGNFAKNKSNLINNDKHTILTANHPSPLSANKGGWFGCNHFSQVNNILSERGEKEINWNNINK